MNSKILSERNVIDIYKNGIITVLAGDPVANASGKYIRVRATI